VLTDRRARRLGRSAAQTKRSKIRGCPVTQNFACQQHHFTLNVLRHSSLVRLRFQKRRRHRRHFICSRIPSEKTFVALRRIPSRVLSFDTKPHERWQGMQTESWPHCGPQFRHSEHLRQRCLVMQLDRPACVFSHQYLTGRWHRELSPKGQTGGLVIVPLESRDVSSPPALTMINLSPTILQRCPQQQYPGPQSIRGTEVSQTSCKF